MKVVWVALLSLALAACGFQLRGSGGTGKVIAVDWQLPSHAPWMNQAVANLGAQTEPKAIVRLDSVQWRRVNIAFDANGYATRYEMQLNVQAAILDRASGELLQASKAYRIARQLADAGSSQDIEERYLKEQMAQDMVNRLMTQVLVALRLKGQNAN